MKMIELYPPDQDTKIVQTVNGPLTYKDYLQTEKKRIESNPGRKALLMSKLGFSWLLVNKVTVSRKKAHSSYWPKMMPLGQRKVMS